MLDRRLVVMVVMMAARVVATRRRHGGTMVRRRRQVIVFVPVELIVRLAVQGTVIRMPVISAGWRILAVLRVVRILLRLLACLLALASLHARLFQEPSLLGEPLPFLPVLDLVLADQSERRGSKDGLILAELTDPRRIRRIVLVLILLLQASLAVSQLVDLFASTAGFARGGLLLLRRGLLL